MTDHLDALKTPLFDLHVELGARMVPFAGYAMPVQYPLGVLAEHRWTREKAGLFDVSHMGQARLSGAGAVAVLEALTPTDVAGLAPGEQKYSLFLTETGGICDDLMISRPDDEGLFLVVNAAVKAADFARLKAACVDRDARLDVLEDRALLALQGPAAETALASLAPEVAPMVFMQARRVQIDGIDALVSRSGYTGEDGFEISIPAKDAERLARRLLAHDDVAPIGLGARDSLRLEAGLCLYGHDIDETTSPIEAGLVWAVAKSRRERTDFPGAERILRELAAGPVRKRVGFRMADKIPAREGDPVFAEDGAEIGRVVSGGFGGSVNAAIGFAYVAPEHAKPGAPIAIDVRGKRRAAEVMKLPFAPQRYKRA